MLARLRALQLDGRIATRQEAVEWAQANRPQEPTG
jgi:hypothetical protein